MMNSKQLDCVIKCDPRLRERVVGVFAADQIRELHFITGKEQSFICNTQPARMPGDHWIVISSMTNGGIEFFDSLGNSPQSLSHYFDTFIRKRADMYVFNTRQLQSKSSSVCGHYCLYFLLHRSRDISMQNIVNTFHNNYHANDEFVLEFISSSFPYCLQ